MTPLHRPGKLSKAKAVKRHPASTKRLKHSARQHARREIAAALDDSAAEMFVKTSRR